MEPTLNHDQLQELLAVFALHALDPVEADTVNAHLETCPRCRDEVAQHQQAAALLANTGDDAPPGVWDAIATKIEQPDTAERVQAPSRLSRSPRARGRAPKRSRLAIGAAAIAAVAVAAIAILGVEVGRLDHRLNHVTNSGAPTISAAATHALLDPAAHRVVLTATNSNPLEAAEVVVEPSGAAFLFNRQLTPLPDSQTYQLWNMIGGRAVSVGLLGPHPSVAAFYLNPAHSTGPLAVTIEPAGGSVAPTRPPIASTTT